MNVPVLVMAGDLETVLDAFTPRTQIEEDAATRLRKAMNRPGTRDGHDDAPLQGN